MEADIKTATYPVNYHYSISIIDKQMRNSLAYKTFKVRMPTIYL